jgi:hypothetical protein
MSALFDAAIGEADTSGFAGEPVTDPLDLIPWEWRERVWVGRQFRESRLDGLTLVVTRTAFERDLSQLSYGIARSPIHDLRRPPRTRLSSSRDRLILITTTSVPRARIEKALPSFGTRREGSSAWSSPIRVPSRHISGVPQDQLQVMLRLSSRITPVSPEKESIRVGKRTIPLTNIPREFRLSVLTPQDLAELTETLRGLLAYSAFA